MQQYDNLFKNKKVNIHKLLKYGFVKNDASYTYQTTILNHFDLYVDIDENNHISTNLIDTTTNDVYILHKVSSANGFYVNKIREEYMHILTDIANHCFEYNVFKSKQADAVIKYVKQKYNDELQFLWKNSNNAVLRRADNQKWYAVFLLVQKAKLNLTGNELIEIIDLRVDSKELTTLIDNQKYFPGFHMNKKNWLTICLDESVDINEIKTRIDTSYKIANK